MATLGPVIPIFALPAGKTMELVGSGVLLQTQGGVWLVTAAHVLVDLEKHPLFVPGGPGIYFPIPGTITISGRSLQDARRELSPDLGYVAANAELLAGLLGLGFGPWVMGPATICDGAQVLANQPCVVAGYPISETTPIDTASNAVSLVVVKSRFVSDAMLHRLGLATQDHVGVRYRCKPNNRNAPRWSPWPQGMSGGAIWHREGERLKLAGIFAEFRNASGYILGTRISRLQRHFAVIGIPFGI